MVRFNIKSTSNLIFIFEKIKRKSEGQTNIKLASVVTCFNLQNNLNLCETEHLNLIGEHRQKINKAFVRTRKLRKSWGLLKHT